MIYAQFYELTYLISSLKLYAYYGIAFIFAIITVLMLSKLQHKYTAQLNFENSPLQS